MQNTNTTISIGANDLNLPSNAPTGFSQASVGSILLTVYFLAGMVAVVVIIIGGIRYVTSNGDSSGVKSAKDTILYAIVGLVVVIMAAAITSFVLSNVK